MRRAKELGLVIVGCILWGSLVVLAEAYLGLPIGVGYVFTIVGGFTIGFTYPNWTKKILK